MGEGNASLDQREIPEDLVQHPSWKGLQQHVFVHAPLISRQTHRIHAHEQKYEIQHSNIAPENEQETINNECKIYKCIGKWPTLQTNLVEKKSKMSEFHSLIDICILTNDERRLPSEL